MYCTRCGKYIEYDAIVCDECVEAMKIDADARKAASEAGEEKSCASDAAEAYTGNLNEVFFIDPIAADPKNRMFGFGKALTSVILSVFAFIFSYAAIIGGAFDTGSGAIFLLLAIAPTVISIVFGAKSIKSFKARSVNGCAKPIPTLVLGIHGLAIGATASFLLSIAFIVVGTLA